MATHVQSHTYTRANTHSHLHTLTQDLANTNLSLNSKVAELELALAAARRGGGDGAEFGVNAALGGSLMDPLGEKAKDMRRQVGFLHPWLFKVV